MYSLGLVWYGCHLSGCGREFLLAAGAGEVVGVVHLPTEPQGLPVWGGMENVVAMKRTQ